MGRREQFTVGEITVTGSIKDTSGHIGNRVVTSIPADGTAGYLPGCTLTYNSAGVALGAVPLWINYGSATSCKFRPEGRQLGWGIRKAQVFASSGGDTTETTTIYDTDATFDIGFAGHSTSNDTDNIVSTLLTDYTLTIVGSADPSTAHGYNYGVIRQGCIADYDIVFAGTHTTVGGAAAEAITLTGALATDFGFACYGATNDTDTIAKVVMTANTMTVTCSADPSTAHSLHYMVIRPRGGAKKPTHYIAYAGLHTTVGGAAAEAVTVTGALATDIPIVGYSVTDDTDTILKTVMTADTMTVTCSADPGATHGFWYLILRAY